MNLQEFIKETLLQILRGIGDAKREFHSLGTDLGAIGPMFRRVGDFNEDDIEHVEFDVAVTVSESKEGSGAGKLNVAMLSMGGDKKHAHGTETVSRVKFKVPIIPPKTPID